MLGLRISACLALIFAGCGSPELPPIGVRTGAINSCNVVADCPGLGVTPGACVTAVCNTNHECDAITDTTLAGCAGGCTSDLDCSLGVGACYLPTCNMGTHQCDFTVTGVNSCACKVAGDCNGITVSSCQNAATCVLGVCTLTAKAFVGCCNDAGDCNTMGTAATCNAAGNNRCTCGGGKTYCPVGPSGCVSDTECCQDSDCGTGNTCGDGTCTCNGTDQHCPGVGCLPATACCTTCSGTATCNGSHVCICAGPTTKYCAGIGCIAPTGCCGNSECSGTATCDSTSHTCGCASGERYCAGTGCVPSTGCCMMSDCAARANATVACTANACVYNCNSGFHDCSNVCKANNSVATCGSMCSACPAGNSCQTPACTSGACGFVAAGASPCCNAPADCTPANACQTATACTDNRCVFGSTGASGCCNSATDCATPTNPCLVATCVANQCAEAPVAGCTDDGGGPIDVDMSEAPDQSASVSLSGGGGCALAGGHPGSPLALVVVALFLLAFARRRRAA